MSVVLALSLCLLVADPRAHPRDYYDDRLRRRSRRSMSGSTHPGSSRRGSTFRGLVVTTHALGAQAR